MTSKAVLKFIGHELTRRGPLSPALMKHEEERANSLQSRIADVITGFAGSMSFVYVHLVWFAFWITLPVEKYPYGLLTMIVSLEEIFLSTFVMISQNRAVEARDSGHFDKEIVPVPVAAHTDVDKEGNEIDVPETVVSKDDGPRAGTTMEVLSQLKPVFKPDGTVTAGNSCPLNDGAAAVLLMSDAKAKELGLTPRARIVTAATWGNEPEYMGVAPIGAIKKVLDWTGMTMEDVGTVELNEAFAAQVIPIMDECDIPLEKLNTHGGAIALGHPFWMTGARIMGTLLNAMETDDHQVGLETMCVAGGQGEAMLVERV